MKAVSLKMLLVEGGYYDNQVKQYYFYIQDHLGNNRVVVDANGVINQRNDYYPFGKRFEDGANFNPEFQPYLYNGKEGDKSGIDWYDYGARMMNFKSARFSTVDPMAEMRYSVSPYAYCQDNPINRIDPTGMLDDWFQDQNGNVKWIDSSAEQYTDNSGNAYQNVGQSISVQNMGGDGYVNYYQNAPVSITETPVDAGRQIINSPALTVHYLGSSSPLHVKYQSQLMGDYINKGRAVFLFTICFF